MADVHAAEMAEMARTLGVDHMLEGAARAKAEALCGTCARRETCKDWLDIMSIRGADHAPDFCLNTDLFADLASEARTGF